MSIHDGIIIHTYISIMPTTIFIHVCPYHILLDIGLTGDFYFISTFPLCTVACFSVVGFFVGVGTVNVELFTLPSIFFALGATVSCATPAGESAISLISRVVRESLRGAARDWRRRVVGPLKWRNSL